MEKYVRIQILGSFPRKPGLHPWLTTKLWIRVSKKGIDLIDSGFEYQIKFENLVKSTKNLENNCPKMNDGTIKKYLTDF